MSGESKHTTDHQTIRHWAEERGGKPVTVRGTQAGDEPAGILRIDFPGYSGDEKLQEISWEDFFQKFDEAGLDFVYQEETSDGRKSNFNKFVSR